MIFLADYIKAIKFYSTVLIFLGLYIVCFVSCKDDPFSPPRDSNGTDNQIIEIISPDSGSYVAGNLEIKIKISDPLEFLTLEFYVNDSLITNIFPDTSDITYSWSVPSLLKAQFEIYVEGKTKSSVIKSNKITVHTFIIPPPSNLSSEPIDKENIRLRWHDNSSFEDGFLIEEYNPKSGGKYNAIAYLDSNTTEFNIKPLNLEYYYLYRIKAVKENIKSEPTNNVRVSYKREHTLTNTFNGINEPGQWGNWKSPVSGGLSEIIAFSYENTSKVNFFNISNGLLSQYLLPDTVKVLEIKNIPGTENFVVGTTSSEIYAVDGISAQLLYKADLHVDSVTALSAYAGLTSVLVGTASGHAGIINLQYNYVHTIKELIDLPILSIAKRIEDDSQLMTANTSCLYRWYTSHYRASCIGKSGLINYLIFEDGFLYAGLHDGRLLYSNPDSYSTPLTEYYFQAHQKAVAALDFELPYLVTVGKDNYMKVFQIVLSGSNMLISNIELNFEIALADIALSHEHDIVLSNNRIVYFYRNTSHWHQTN